MDVRESPPAICLFEGAEPVCSTSAILADGELTARWDYMRVEIRLAPKLDSVVGFYGRIGARLLPHITATRYRPTAAPSGAAQVGGTWEVHSKEQSWVSWRLILEQNGSELKGTMLKLDGDLGTFSGRIEGTRFLISHFAGDRPLVINGDLRSDGTLDFEIAGGTPRTRYYALRPAEARARGLKPPGDPTTDATVISPGEPFRFSFPDLEGRTVTEKDFSGKPLIVSITGSWCSNCRDEAPLLTELFRHYGPRGLAVVGLCFEREDDTAYEFLKAFIHKFEIAYPMLLAGEPGKLRQALPQIKGLDSFPTTIFVSADGRVRLIHVGFPGKASGEVHRQVEKEFRSVVEAMLSDKPRDR